MAASETKIDMTTLLLASAVDRLSTLVWSKTKDAEKGRHRPGSIVALLTDRKKPSENVLFDTPEAYEAERARILEQIKEGS
jgi:hypothetical protein